MAYFQHVCLMKAPIVSRIPTGHLMDDLIEVCYLAAMVERDVSSVSIPVDIYGRDPFGAFERFLRRHPADLVGISTMTGGFTNALRLAETAKRFDKFVVMGGYHPSALPEAVLESPYIDAVVIGEGEQTFRELVLRGPSRDVAGLAFRENGGIFTAEPRPVIDDLDSIPQPLRSARPQRFGEPGEDYSIDTVYTSRGCPCRCTFCANDMVNKRWRGRSPENVVEEIASLHDPKRRKLLRIWDADAFADIDRLGRICDLMIERKLTNFKIWAEARVVDMVRAERIMPALERIGLSYVVIGIESPNPETLRLMKKPIPTGSLDRAVEILNRHQIKAVGTFIIGHYSEAPEDMDRLPGFAAKLGLHRAFPMLLTPYPGTAIFEQYQKERKVHSLDWDLYNNFGAVVGTRTMDRAELLRRYMFCWGRMQVHELFMRERNPLGGGLIVMFHMLLISGMLRANKVKSREAMCDGLFEFLRGVAGKSRMRLDHVRDSFLLRLLAQITFRFVRERGRSIDLTVTQLGDHVQLSMGETSDTRPVTGLTIRLHDFVRIADRIPLNELTSLTGCSETVNVGTKNSLKRVFGVLANRQALGMLLPAVRFATARLVEGLVSILARRSRR